MQPVTFYPAMLLAVLPELALVVLAALVLTLNLVWHERTRRSLAWITAGGLLVIMALTAFFAQPPADPILIFGGMLRLDGVSFVFRLLFLLGAAVTALFMADEESAHRQGEFYALLLIATLGMSLMASAADLIMLYLAIETTSLPLYVMAGSRLRDDRSTEAGIKYFLFGAMTAAVMLYGFSLLYGMTGVTNLYALTAQLQAGALSPFVLPGVLALVLVGFGFKVSAAPFHFWAPDVYEGAPSPVAGFLSTASKAAGFAVLLRVLSALYPAAQPEWTAIIAVLAAASMIIGNVMAAVQKNIKRMLAYSSIAQAGYMLVGVAAGSALGSASVTFYLFSYLVTNLAAFGIIALVGRTLGSDNLIAYSGLQRRSPGLALALLIALLSLGGVPLFSGFVGKLFVFAAAVQSGTLGIALAFIGILTSVIGLYYYLNVIMIVYVHPTPVDHHKLHMTATWRTALLVCIALIVMIGTVIGPWYGLSVLGSAPLF